MTLTDYGRAAWNGVMFGIGSLPAHWYVCLLVDEPGEGWDGTVVQTLEPVDPGVYARQPLAPGTDWALTDGGFVINSTQLDFGTPALDWGLVNNYGLTDDPDAGNLWLFGDFLDPFLVIAGTPLTIDEGAIYHALGNELPTIAE